MGTNNTMVKVEGLWKKYCKSLQRSAFYTLADAARGALGLPSGTGRLRKAEFWALKQIGFELKRGECLGLIGPNGAGKSTLLKVISGMIEPDRGRVEVRGRVGALIQLGAGFHPQLTGRENIYVNGAILGMSRREIKRKFDSIVEFADIGDFLDTPIKFYSSGMLVRLGFAVAVHTEPDVLLVDEVLAVGDLGFRAKCYERMDELRSGPCALVFVSHTMSAIGRMCERVCYLEGGEPAYLGDTDEAISRYRSSQVSRRRTVTRPGLMDAAYVVEDVSFHDREGRRLDEVNTGETITVRIALRCNRPVGKGFANLAIRTAEGEFCSVCRSRLLDLSAVGPGQSIRFELELKDLPLLPGTYMINMGLLSRNKVGSLGTTPGPYLLTVKGRVDRPGVFDLPHSWRFSPPVRPAAQAMVQ